MSLNHFQKKFIKNNIRKMPPDKISAHLEIPQEEIFYYLKGQWKKEKYDKYIKSLKNGNASSESNASVNEIDLSGLFQKRQNLFILLFLTFLVAVTYINSLNNVFLSDDITGILENKDVGTWQGVLSQPLFPIRPFLYFIAFNLGGLNPAFFRLINIFMHLGSVFMLYLILNKITKKQIAFFAASIFAVHPLLVESITWISGGGYSQYTFFFLLSVFFYINSGSKLKYYILSLLAFITALFSSVTAVSLSLVYLIYELSFGNLRKNWLRVIPYFIFSGTMFIVAFAGVGRRLEVQRTVFYQTQQGTGNIFTQAVAAVNGYLELLVWPDKLTLYHTEMTFSLFDFSLRTVIFILFLAVIIYTFFKNKFVFFWLSLFLISLLPTLNPFGISWIVAERYAYLGTAGIVSAFSFFFYKLYSKQGFWKGAATILLMVILVSLGTRTIVRNIDWKNEDNLWIATARTSPSSPNNHNNLGDVYFRRGDYKKAIEEFKQAIKIKPNYGDAYHNLANAYFKAGDAEMAIENYKKAISLNPALWQSYSSLAIIYFNKEDYVKAEENFKAAVSILPSSALYQNLGVTYIKMNEKAKAKEALEKSVNLDPNNEKAKQLLLQVF